MRIVNFLLAGIFLVLALWEVNEPQPVLWILLYGAMALVSIMAMYDVYYKTLLMAIAAGISVFGIILYPTVQHTLFSEGSHEMARLVICLVILIFYFIQSLRVK